MKNPTPAPKKAPRNPVVECHQTNYSETALRMMEQATGQRYARSTPKPVRVPVPAADVD